MPSARAPGIAAVGAILMSAALAHPLCGQGEVEAALFLITEGELRRSPREYFGFVQQASQVQQAAREVVAEAWEHRCPNKKYMVEPNLTLRQEVRGVTLREAGIIDVEMLYTASGGGYWKGGAEGDLWCRTLGIGCLDTCNGNIKFDTSFRVRIRVFLWKITTELLEVEINSFVGKCKTAANEDCPVYNAGHIASAVVNKVDALATRQLHQLSRWWGVKHEHMLSSQAVLQYRLGSPQIVRQHPDIGYQVRVCAALRRGNAEYQLQSGGPTGLSTSCRDRPQPGRKLVTPPLGWEALRLTKPPGWLRSEVQTLQRRGSTLFVLFSVTPHDTDDSGGGVNIRLYSDSRNREAWSIQVTIGRKKQQSVVEFFTRHPPTWEAAIAVPCGEVLSWNDAFWCEMQTGYIVQQKNMLAWPIHPDNNFWVSVDLSTGRVGLGEGHDMDARVWMESLTNNFGNIRQPVVRQDLHYFDFGSVRNKPSKEGAEWQVYTMQKACSGWDKEITKGLRLSTSLLSGALWLSSTKTYSEARQLLDTNMVSRLVLGTPSLQILHHQGYSNDSMLLFVPEGGVSTTCLHNSVPGEHSKKMLLNMSMSNVSGSGYVKAVPNNGSLRISVQFEHMSEVFSQFNISTPKLPLPPETIRSAMRSFINRLVSPINHGLLQAGLTLPRALSAQIPYQTASVHAINSSGIGYVEFRRTRELGAIEEPLEVLALVDDPASSMGQPGELGPLANSSVKVAALFIYGLLCVNIGMALGSWQARGGHDRQGDHERDSASREKGMRGTYLWVAVLCLFIQGWTWVRRSPFAPFSADNFRTLGVPDQYNMEGVARIFEQWSWWGQVLTLFSAVVFALFPLVFSIFSPQQGALNLGLPAVRGVLTVASILVLIVQFGVLVGRPMQTFIGRELASELTPQMEASVGREMRSAWTSDTSTLALFIEAIAHIRSSARVLDYPSTLLNNVFTSIFVSYLGAYFIVLLVGLPMGMYMGALAFADNYWEEAQHGSTMEMAMIFTIITEFLSSASMMAPLTIICQTLGGDLMCLWGALLVCLCRLLVFTLAVGTPRARRPRLSIFLGGLALGVCSVLGVFLVRSSINQALEPLHVLQLNECMTASLFVSIVVVAAVAHYCVLESHVQHSDAAEEIPSISNTSSLRCPVQFLRLRQRLCGCFPWEKLQILDWTFWFLSMDAIATLIYHFFKMSVILWQKVGAPGSQDWVKAGSNSFLAWRCAAPLFLVSCLLAWVVSVFHEARNQDKSCRDMIFQRLREYWCCCSRSSGLPPDGSLAKPLLHAGSDGEEVERVAGIDEDIDNRNVEGQICSDEEKMVCSENAEVDDAGRKIENVVRRKEFLLLGLGHSFLCVARGWIDWHFHPHDIPAFHHVLQQEYDLVLPAGHTTAFDETWQVYQSMRLISLAFATASLAFLILATAYHLSGRTQGSYRSRLCMFAVGALAALSAMVTLTPDYEEQSAISYYCTGCAPQYDKYAKFITHATVGVSIAALLGINLFWVLFTLPVSAVRAVWLLLVEKPSTTHRRLLSSLMRLVACLTPAVTVYPLLFFNQVTADPQSQYLLLAFWVAPSLLVISLPSHYGEKYFYGVWLVCYLGLFSLWAALQVRDLGERIDKLIRFLDWPWLWSAMHADFCVANVLLTDILSSMMTHVMEKQVDWKTDERRQETRLDHSDIDVLARTVEEGFAREQNQGACSGEPATGLSCSGQRSGEEANLADSSGTEQEVAHTIEEDDASQHQRNLGEATTTWLCENPRSEEEGSTGAQEVTMQLPCEHQQLAEDASGSTWEELNEAGGDAETDGCDEEEVLRG